MKLPKEPAEKSWFQEESSNEQRNCYRHFQDADRGSRLQHIIKGTSSANIARLNNQEYYGTPRE